MKANSYEITLGFQIWMMNGSDCNLAEFYVRYEMTFVKSQNNSVKSVNIFECLHTKTDSEVSKL